MKYFFNARLDNTRYRLADGFLLCFGTPLVRPKIAGQECQAQCVVGGASGAHAAPLTALVRKPLNAEAIKRGH